MTQIDHPDYYSPGNYECISIIEQMKLGEGFCIGNAIKYISRAGKKKDAATVDDLKKAAWYLSRFMRHEPVKVKQREKNGVPRTMELIWADPKEVIDAWGLEMIPNTDPDLRGHGKLGDALMAIFVGDYSAALAILNRIIKEMENENSS